jgi:hypothetical protein
MSTDVESLSSILSNAAPPAEEAAPAKVEAEPVIPEAKAEEQPAAKARDEQGRFAKDEKEEKPEISRRDVAAIIDERKKRQEVEAKLKELQAQTPKTDIWTDPEKAISERVTEATAPLRQKFFKMSIRTAEKLHEDFHDAADAFAKATETDSQLVQAMNDADDPGEYIYNIGLHLKEMSDVGGDFSKYKAKLTGEMKAQIADKDKTIAALTAELETLKTAKAELSQVPKTLNRTQSGAAPATGDADPDDLKFITRFGNKR